MPAFPGTGNGMAVRASGIQQLFSTPFQVRLLGVGKLRENGSGNRNERQVDGGTHASGSSLNEAPNRGGYSEKGVFLRSDTALQYPFCDAPRAIRLLQKFGAWGGDTRPFFFSTIMI